MTTCDSDEKMMMLKTIRFRNRLLRNVASRNARSVVESANSPSRVRRRSGAGAFIVDGPPKQDLRRYGRSLAKFSLTDPPLGRPRATLLRAEAAPPLP